MHKRPKKHRLSDINRNNSNLNKCITKIEGAPSDYTIISAEGKLHYQFLLVTFDDLFPQEYLKIREKALLFWENGDPDTEWDEITEEDKMMTLPTNISPPPSGSQKKPPLVRSGTR